MTPRELLASLQQLATGDALELSDGRVVWISEDTGNTKLLAKWCASELEAALAQGEWQPIETAPLGVPLELWGSDPPLQGVQPYEGGGWSLRRTLDLASGHDLRPIFASQGVTHARRVPPPPGENE